MIAYPPALRRSGFVGPREGGESARAQTPPHRRVVVRLWLPMTPIFLILAPFAILLAPLLYGVPRPYCERPFATVFGVGALLLSLGGAVVDVDTPEALVRIRIF